MDGFYIYDINTEDLSYTIREKKLVFPLMRENQVYSYYHAYIGGAKIANDGIDALTQVFNGNENFALIATGESAWFITETNQYLFQESYLGSTEISDEVVDHVRKTILKEQKASFYRHKIVSEEVGAELEAYEQKRQDAEKNFQFPSGTVLMKELFQEDIYDMLFTVFAMEGNTYVMSFSNEKMNEILSELGNLELTTDFEKQHGAGGERIELRLVSDNGWALTYTERTDEMTIEVAKDNKKMTYALTDSELREKGILLPLMETMLEGSQKKVSNGTYDIPLITARFNKEGYTVSGEPGVYSYPYNSIKNIDFSEFTIYCDGYQVEEISTEPGEHILNLLVSDNEEYVLKYFIE